MQCTVIVLGRDGMPKQDSHQNVLDVRTRRALVNPRLFLVKTLLQESGKGGREVWRSGGLPLLDASLSNGVKDAVEKRGPVLWWAVQLDWAVQLYIAQTWLYIRHAGLSTRYHYQRVIKNVWYVGTWARTRMLLWMWVRRFVVPLKDTTNVFDVRTYSF